MKPKKTRLQTLIKDVEKVTKRLRADVRKRATAAGLPRSLESAADQLRKRAAEAAVQVEKYVRSLRLELERGAKKPAAKKKSTAKKKATARKKTTTRKKSAARSKRAPAKKG